MSDQETIAAIATSSQNGSISVIRVSGEEAFSLVSQIFCDGKGNPMNLNQFQTHTIQYGFIYDGEKRIDEVLQIVSLANTGKKKAGQFSLGMKQRLGIAMALLGEPKLLILDEPTNGLDPIGIEELRELIRSFPSQGITVILSSHILSEVQLLADYVGIISDGILGYEGPLEQGENLEELFMNVVRENRKAGESCA